MDEHEHGRGDSGPMYPRWVDVIDATADPLENDARRLGPLATAPATYPPAAPRRAWLLPLVLYLGSIASAFYAYYTWSDTPVGGTVWELVRQALIYSGAIIFILTAHELGHFFQAMRYSTFASFPYFIPMPFSPIGTMGAMIIMRGHMGHRKALFDIGISGPLAGLVPALAFTVLGIYWSDIRAASPDGGLMVSAPLLFSWLVDRIQGPLAPGYALELHPLAFAGWVGFLITSLNLFPVGQLDGGHILYAMLRRKSYPVAIFVLLGSVVGMALTGAYQWMLMALLLMTMGPLHPPTANDDEPLGVGRVCLGVLTLLFVIVGFTVRPFGF